MSGDWIRFTLFLRVLARQIIVSLVLTILLEGVAAFVAGLRTGRQQKTLALINVITNPVVVFLFYLYYYYGPGIPLNPLAFQLVLEAFVVLAEWRLLRMLLPELKKPFWWAFGLNLFSWGLWYLLELIVRR
ncbi:MAG: hypothetical protein IK016_03145 [Lachnospiraceae bacterium]|nr:hypothetical protein [Lachnospiraceae bacterium]